MTANFIFIMMSVSMLSINRTNHLQVTNTQNKNFENDFPSTPENLNNREPGFSHHGPY
ncbi:hypothetical protein Hanom_Chr16g01511311 [Helianthus anomalus]